MGLLDSVMGAVEKHEQVNQGQHSQLVQSAVEMFRNHADLSSLVSNAKSQGLGHLVESWISNGQNQQAEPQHVQQLLGQERLNQLASRAGVPAGVASAALSKILPAVVDKLTPQGKLPQAA